MAPARFAIKDTAFILIDHQLGTTSWIGSMDQAELKKNAVTLAKFAKVTGIPVVLTSSQETNVQGLLLPELAEAQPEAYEARVKRQGIVNAWDDPAFAAACRATGKRHFVLAGATTDVCVVPPATSAVLEGYNVKVVLDACGSPTEMADKVAWLRLEAAGAQLITTNAILSELVGDWASPEGQAAFHLLLG
jgi:nicotinamidase-related amidase